MNKNNKSHKYRSIYPFLDPFLAVVRPYETDSSNETVFFFIGSPPKSRYTNKTISGRLVGKYPLSLDDKVKEAQKKLAKMSKAQKWKLIEESFGMWKDYPQNWLERIREGTWIYDYARDTNESEYFVYN